jgi:D-alanine--poly(phosphoribitol) ligase subunit 1
LNNRDGKARTRWAPSTRKSRKVITAYNIGLKFHEFVASSPAKTAIFCDGEALGFAALNALANRFARCLKDRGVGRGQIVALQLPKRIETYALLLACIKIGAPYVFVDPSAPVQRTQRVFSHCQPSLVIGADEGVEGASSPVFVNLNALTRRSDGFDGANLAETAEITGSDPAYVMFTSGSTGEPKGAVIPHQGVINLADWAASSLAIGPSDRLSNVNPLHFDNSVFDVYAGLLNGAAVIGVDALKGQPPRDITDSLTRHHCTFFFAVPTLFMHLDSMRLLTPDRLPTVNRFMFGGEGYPLSRLRRFHESFAGRARLINCYGPTETSCICSSYDITPEVFETQEGLAPLGRLNPNFSHRILDADLRPVRPGDAGELWLGGPCVGLGYVNNPEETEFRFRQDPLIGGFRSVFYRTGDLVQEDGQTRVLRFRGRADNQVKMRGYRIELEEIDHALATIPGVERALAVVLRSGDGGGRIAAAYCGRVLADADLIAECRTRLPDYMTPGQFVWVESLPTNSNGKADRRGAASLIESEMRARIRPAAQIKSNGAER